MLVERAEEIRLGIRTGPRGDFIRGDLPCPEAAGRAGGPVDAGHILERRGRAMPAVTAHGRQVFNAELRRFVVSVESPGTNAAAGRAHPASGGRPATSALLFPGW